MPHLAGTVTILTRGFHTSKTGLREICPCEEREGSLAEAERMLCGKLKVPCRCPSPVLQLLFASLSQLTTPGRL